jgi:hypothetical protein
MSDDRAREAIRLWERLEGDRVTFKTHWQDCANNLQPNRSDYITERWPGQKLMQYVFDSVPMWALESFAAGMHGLLTSPTLRWFILRCDDDRIDTIPRVATWLDAAGDAMYSRFNGPRHNFASQSYELYMDLGCIGTAVMGVMDSSKTGTLFSTRHMKECVIAENDEDRVDTLARSWRYTAEQAYGAWGPAAGEGVLKALDKTPERKFRFIHMTRPRRDRDPQRADRLHKAWQSIYVNVDDMTTIDEGGFDEFPYLAPRFSRKSDEVYGRSPGMTALPDVKMLYEMKKTVIKGAQKVVDPPLQMPDDGYLMPIKTVPGALVYYRAGTQDRIEPIKTGGDLQIGNEMIQALQSQIMRSFYVEWMLMPSTPDDPASAGKGITATYVLQQRDEKMRLLSPMLARLQSEFLGPLIDRTFALMWRESMRYRFGPGSPFPPPPPELQHQRLNVEYVSPIAVAQKTSQLDSIMRLVQMQLQLIQADPNTPRVVDGEGILRIAARDLNTPTLALKSPERLAQEQQAAAEAQAQLNGHMQMQSLARTAKDGTAAVANLAQAA